MRCNNETIMRDICFVVEYYMYLSFTSAAVGNVERRRKCCRHSTDTATPSNAKPRFFASQNGKSSFGRERSLS